MFSEEHSPCLYCDLIFNKIRELNLEDQCKSSAESSSEDLMTIDCILNVMARNDTWLVVSYVAESTIFSKNRSEAVPAYPVRIFCKVSNCLQTFFFFFRADFPQLASR